jgi:2-hydroxy-3-oxopropionate reductase
MKIAFLGVGLMGTPMVERLLAADFGLNLWTRTQSKLQAFDGRATLAASPGGAIDGSDVVITMLESGPVVDSVLYQGEALNRLKPGALVIDMSSIPPALARRHAQCVTRAGGWYLDAPVSGGTVGAAAGTLSIMAGGAKSAFDAAQPVFNALGKSYHIGPNGCGQLSKLANQAIVGITIGAVSEALLLAAAGGADPAAVREALLGGFASSRILELHGQRMLERNFTPGARASVQLKDLQTILDAAREEKLCLPLSQRVYEEYLALVASGHQDVDHSGLLLALEQLNGVRLDMRGSTDA